MNIYKQHMDKLTQVMSWNSWTFSKWTANEKDRDTPKIFQIRCYFGMAADWQILWVFWARAWELLLQKPQWRAICSAKVSTLLICPLNQPIIASQLLRIIQVSWSCVRWPWEIAMRKCMRTTWPVICLMESIQLRVWVKMPQDLRITAHLMA